ncbi:hypothetical protein JI435_300540 [Parastagonospora nodorum SN15]|uniref:Uncharacterized protein n=1 Tax=Phaeosphaeria nodorum (strain SN15 / ATCC MYA-4574 / FGSC 10173) TaxID=321614 RepID=A0A7U2EQY4_PHANO|nr:hypothetical protein JI435_300540 [Parastagonospora nodorum SN15]
MPANNGSWDVLQGTALACQPQFCSVAPIWRCRKHGLNNLT